MIIIRELRHPFINCVIGHFQTGCSLIQVNDWFDGHPLSTLWGNIKQIDFVSKICLLVKLLQAVGYCHSKGVFHRNISSDNVLINDNLEDLRLTGFKFAKDVELTRTMTSSSLQSRNPFVIPPEELVGQGNINFRLYDIYQLGILFYQVLENGKYPFEDVIDYMTSPVETFEFSFTNHCCEPGFPKVASLVKRMLEVNPLNRPDVIEKIETEIADVINPV